MAERRCGDFDRGPSDVAGDASLQVACVWCETLHGAEHALEFNPVCSTCATRRLILRSLQMHGSYPLSDESIDEELTRTSPGNYALGYMDGGAFVVFYVGRADSDLRQCLHDWVGKPSRYDRHAPASKAPWASRAGGFMPLGRPALDRVGSGADTGYTRFAFSFAASADAAFEKECRNYDDFGGCGELDNEAPPTRPMRSVGKLPN